MSGGYLPRVQFSIPVQASCSGSLEMSIQARERDTSKSSSGVNLAQEFEDPQAGYTVSNLSIDSSQ